MSEFAHAVRTPLENLTPSVEYPVTICVLLYGDHFELCKRFFDGLFNNTPAEAYVMRIGLNAPCPKTANFVLNLAAKRDNVQIFHSAVNIYKAPMMRRLFHEKRLCSRWCIWFDDDSYVTRRDWLLSLAFAIESRPDIAMWGSRRIMNPDTALSDFIKAAHWYRGRPLQHEPNSGREFVEFIVGGFWAIRSQFLTILDWPDPRLIHFEDDYLLGEALHQHGLEIGTCESGIIVNAAARRAPQNTPSGR